MHLYKVQPLEPNCILLLIKFQSHSFCFSFLRELGCHLKQVTEDAKSFSYLWQRLSIAVQRGNAVALMGIMGLDVTIISVK